MTIRSRLRLALALIAAVILAGAAGFHYIEGWPWFDGLYMTLITMTTVGYGETHALSLPGRVFNTFLIVGAVLAGGFLVATSTQAMLEFEFKEFLGRRRMERELAKLKDHFIVCGAGRVGRTVVRELRSRGEPCVLVEMDPAQAEWAVNEGIPVVIGSGHTEEVLQRARIEAAQGLVAAVTSDADNLYIVLTARGMNPNLRIIARASEDEATPKLRRAGASEVVSPYNFVGRRIAQILLQPHVIDFIETAFGTERMDIQIEEVEVPAGSPLAGSTLAAANIGQNTGVLVLALRHGNGTLSFNPAAETVIQPGDCLIAIGPTEPLKKLDALVQS
ncbi:MAG: potassium channel family protein [Candidatus Acidiferrales bacterium]